MTTLFFKDKVGLERDNLDTLYDQLGATNAENIVCRAMEELAVRLADLSTLHRAERYPELAKLSRSMVGIAEQIGLTTLAAVAGDVSQCAKSTDTVALAATLRRLERVGDQSLTAVWDLRDLSV